MHTGGGPAMFSLGLKRAMGPMWSQIGADPANEVVIFTGTGQQWMAGGQEGGPRTCCSPVRPSAPRKRKRSASSTRYCPATSSCPARGPDRGSRTRRGRRPPGLGRRRSRRRRSRLVGCIQPAGRVTHDPVPGAARRTADPGFAAQLLQLNDLSPGERMAGGQDGLEPIREKRNAVEVPGSDIG